MVKELPAPARQRQRTQVLPPDPRSVRGHPKAGVTLVRTSQRGGSFSFLTFAFSKACAQFVEFAFVDMKPSAR
jgi:hypothetical protein